MEIYHKKFVAFSILFTNIKYNKTKIFSTFANNNLFCLRIVLILKKCDIQKQLSIISNKFLTIKKQKLTEAQKYI